MQPNSSNLYDSITIKNIDTDIFEFGYDGQPYSIPPGGIVRYPRFLADHALKHLVNQLLNKKDIPTNNQIKRAELAAQCVVDVTPAAPPPEKTPQQLLDEELKKLNKPSDLELILARKKLEAQGPATPPPPPPASSVTPPP